MPSVFKKMQGCFRWVFIMFEEFLEPLGISLVRQEAAACGSGVIGDAELFGQFYLGFSAPTGKIPEVGTDLQGLPVPGSFQAATGHLAVLEYTPYNPNFSPHIGAMVLSDSWAADPAPHH